MTASPAPSPAPAPSPVPAKERLLPGVLAGVVTHWVVFAFVGMAGVGVSPFVALVPLVGGALVHARWPQAWQRVVLPVAAGLIAMRVLFALVSLTGVTYPSYVAIAVGMAGLGATVARQRTHTLRLAWSPRSA